MEVNNRVFFAANAFSDAYFHSDLLGKLIFLGLIALSIITWIILLHKGWVTYQARKYSMQFYAIIQLQKAHLLNLDVEQVYQKGGPNPFLDLYTVLKKQTLDILNKNRHFTTVAPHSPASPYLSLADIDFVDTHLMSHIAMQTKQLEKNLFILATVVSLGPFLGLLGTVWGILTTFSELQSQNLGSTNEMVIGGLSLALATTVLGLLDAIPALVGYNYLKNTINAFSTDMEAFSTEILAAVEMQYRKVDLG
jgi:biopolymer transport protein TolQ